MIEEKCNNCGVQLMGAKEEDFCEDCMKSYDAGYNKALEDVEEKIKGCRTAWKIKDSKSYIREDWLKQKLRELKNLKGVSKE